MAKKGYYHELAVSRRGFLTICLMVFIGWLIVRCSEFLNTRSKKQIIANCNSCSIMAGEEFFIAQGNLVYLEKINKFERSFRKNHNKDPQKIFF